MTLLDMQEREECCCSQREGVEASRRSRRLDDLCAMFGAGEVRLEGEDALISQLIPAGLEPWPAGRPGQAPRREGRPVGLTARELTKRVRGEDRREQCRRRRASDPWGPGLPRSPPALVPKGARRVGGLVDIIAFLCAGGMTVRDIEHHLVSTAGTEISRETISKNIDGVGVEVMV